MGEGCFGSIQLINNFVSVGTPLWGKFDLDSAPKGSWSQHDFEAFGHKEIALYKKFTVYFKHFIWSQIHFYNAVFVLFFIRCLHGESRYTTDSTHIGVTLDYVVGRNQSLPQTISLLCTFSRLPWCKSAPFGSMI
jgi:hypothetical protein